MKPTSAWWSVSSDDIQSFQGNGEGFTNLMDDLLRASALEAGLPLSELVTNSRIYFPDGGVDTEVRAGAPRTERDKLGWLAMPAVWQYKARDLGGSRGELKDAITHKKKDRFVKQKIRDGFAYRYCVSIPLAPRTIKSWETKLDLQAQKVRADSPPVRVVDAGQIAQCVARYPALVCKYFARGHANTMDHRSWSETLCNSLPHFVHIVGWQATHAQVVAHSDLSTTPSSVLLTVAGASGVGKTRLICEALLERAPLVLYTDDQEQALALAHVLLRERSLAAILVADECDIATSHRLEELLAPHTERVRVITIDNSAQSVYRKNHLVVSKMSEDELLAVLEKNYPYVPATDRKRAAKMGDGYARFASILCKEPETAGGSIKEYLGVRFKRWPHHVFDVFKLLSLFPRLSFRASAGTAQTELEVAASARNLVLPSGGLADVVKHLNQTGFLNVAGSICYVTPEIVANATFELAWEEIGDGLAFVNRLPEHLADGFRKRVQNSAPPAICEEVATFFSAWTRRLVATDLFDCAKVERLSNLIKLDTGVHLPRLRSLIERTSIATLGTVSGASEGGEWGPRRTLVWLCEQLVSFPEHFDDTELILRRLALSESEPGIGNNATAVWCQLYRPLLSGTAVDFATRISKLEALALADDDTAALAVAALSGALAVHVGRMMGAKVVGGRSRPDDWQPKDSSEYDRCGDQLVGLLVLLGQKGSEKTRVAVEKAITSNIRALLRGGRLESVANFVSRKPVDDQLLTRLLDGLDDYLHFDAKQLSPKQLEATKNWRASLLPTGMRGRIVDAMVLDAWTLPGGHRDPSFQAELALLAQTLVDQPLELKHAMDYLNSPDAKNAGLLGDLVGQRDNKGQLWPQLRERLQTARSSFVRCYIMGLLAVHPEHAKLISENLDQAEALAPAETIDAALAAPALLDPTNRLLRLIKAGRLPLVHIKAVTGRCVLKRPEVERLLAFLSLPEYQSDPQASVLELEIASQWVWQFTQSAGQEPDGLSPEMVQSLFLILERQLSCRTTNAHQWIEILRTIAPANQQRAHQLAASALVADAHFLSDQVQALLSTWAQDNPVQIMEAIGEVLLHHPQRWHLGVKKLTNLLWALPVGVVADWLGEVDIEGARALARHLPTPYVKDEKLVVPELTAHVLERFEADDQIFQSFCNGTHSLQVYTGDIASQHEREAELANHFKSHSLRRIREWAVQEERSSKESAKYWREQDAIWKTE